MKTIAQISLGSIPTGVMLCHDKNIKLLSRSVGLTAVCRLVLEKATLKTEKQRLLTSRSSSWNEPAKDVVNALELAGKSQTDKSPEEIARLVRKIGTNLLISRKTVTISFSQMYELMPSLLASPQVEACASSGGYQFKLTIRCMDVVSAHLPHFGKRFWATRQSHCSQNRSRIADIFLSK